MDFSVEQPEGRTSKERAEANRYVIGVLEKAFRVIDAIAALDGGTLSEISAASGLGKPTTLRILSNLVAHDYAERDRNSRYRLGVRLLQLGALASAGIELRTVARPTLVALWNELDETINLAVPVEHGIVYIDIMESARGLRMSATVGTRDEYHSAALGKAMLSLFPESLVRERVGKEPLPRKTGRTLGTVSELFDDLKRVRLQGYAVDDEENEPGARCVATPIVDQRGFCAGAISISGPATRITADRIPDLSDRLRVAAAEISRRLGYVGPLAGEDGKDGN